MRHCLWVESAVNLIPHKLPLLKLSLGLKVYSHFCVYQRLLRTNSWLYSAYATYPEVSFYSFTNTLQTLPDYYMPTMCLFSYYSYDSCGHKGIEVVSHCVERLWRAGIDGQLWVCPEEKYNRYLMELSPIIWEGRHGYCRYCQQKYAVGLPSFVPILGLSKIW